MLIIPAIGDEVYEGGWLDPLNDAIHPPVNRRRNPAMTGGCPEFRSTDTVLWRPDGDPAKPTTVAPGGYEFGTDSASNEPRIAD